MDPVTAGVVAGGVSSAAGAYFNQKSQKKTNEMNLRIAHEQMAFQERMSNSAHQRETEDLRKAGLNRILGVSGSGASAPGGASATMVAPQVGDILSDSVNSGLSAANLQSDLESKKIQQAGGAAAVAKTLVETENAQRVGEGQNIANAKAAATMMDEIANTKYTSKKTKAEAKRSEIGSKMEEADLPRAVQQSEIDKEMGPVDNVIKRIGTALDSVTSALNVSKYFRTPSVKPGTRAEKQALEKAGRKGLPLR